MIYQGRALAVIGGLFPSPSHEERQATLIGILDDEISRSSRNVSSRKLLKFEEGDVVVIEFDVHPDSGIRVITGFEKPDCLAISRTMMTWCHQLLEGHK